MKVGKRLATAATAALLVIPMGVAGHASSSVRHASSHYYAAGSANGTPSVIVIGVDGRQNVGGALFGIKRGERYVSFQIKDAAGGPIAGRISFDRNNDNKYEEVRFCGSTKKPVSLGRAKGLSVVVVASPCSGSNALPTSGDIKATFSR
jgi:hypothetical protein